MSLRMEIEAGDLDQSLCLSAVIPFSPTSSKQMLQHSRGYPRKANIRREWREGRAKANPALESLPSKPKFYLSLPRL